MPANCLRPRLLGSSGMEVSAMSLGSWRTFEHLSMEAGAAVLAPDALASFGVKGVSFDELLGSSDFVSIHAPLTPQTRGLFNTATFNKMKTGAQIINTARGPIIDEKALIEALDSGRLGGAALDVLETEPPPKDSPLTGRPNVVLTPHTAFYSVEALEELQIKCATDVARVLSGQPPVYPAPG